MKGLKTGLAIVLLSFTAISHKVNAQTLTDIDIKPQDKQQIETFQIESNPNSREDNQKAKIYLKKGLELIEAKKYSEAIQTFNEVINIQKNNQYAYFLRGFSYFKLKQYQQAKIDFDKSIQLDSSISYAYFFRGLTNGFLGNKDSAIADLETAAKLFEKNGKTKLAQTCRNVIEQIRKA